MKKRLFVFSDGWKRYVSDDFFLNNNIVLDCLTESLYFVTGHSKYFNTSFTNFPEIDDLKYQEIHFYYIKEQKKVLIWSSRMIKKQDEDYELGDAQEDLKNHLLYWQYNHKRYDEIPKLMFSSSDWEHLEQEWLRLMELRPKYLLVELDDSGPLSKVRLIGKQELSAQDVQDLQQERERYLKYQQAYEQYKSAHPDYSDDLWRTPQDDEYEADIMKYYQD